MDGDAASHFATKLPTNKILAWWQYRVGLDSARLGDKSQDASAGVRVRKMRSRETHCRSRAL